MSLGGRSRDSGLLNAENYAQNRIEWWYETDPQRFQSESAGDDHSRLIAVATRRLLRRRSRASGDGLECCSEVNKACG